MTRKRLTESSKCLNSNVCPQASVSITDSRVPVGAKTFNVVDASSFAAGDEIVVVVTHNDE